MQKCFGSWIVNMEIVEDKLVAYPRKLNGDQPYLPKGMESEVVFEYSERKKAECIDEAFKQMHEKIRQFGKEQQ